MKNKTQKVGGTIAMLGLLLLMGTVGACETETIGLVQTVIQSLLGLGMMKVGVELFNRRKETNR